MKNLFYLIILESLLACCQSNECPEKTFTFENKLTEVVINKNVWVKYEGRDTTCKEKQKFLSLKEKQIDELKCILLDNQGESMVKQDICIEPCYSIDFLDKEQHLLLCIEFSKEGSCYKTKYGQFTLSNKEQLTRLVAFFEELGMEEPGILIF